MSTSDLPTIEVKSLNDLKSSASIYLARVGKDPKGFEVFYVLKFDSNGDFQTRYTIRRTDSGKDSVCDCPAYVSNCRHKRLLSYMIRFGGLNDPNKPIVTDGKQMAWLKSPQQLIAQHILDAFEEQEE